VPTSSLCHGMAYQIGYLQPTGYSPACGPSGEAICQSEGEPKDDQEKPEVAGVIIEKVKERHIDISALIQTQ
jgi:hypothetical protein